MTMIPPFLVILSVVTAAGGLAGCAALLFRAVRSSVLSVACAPLVFGVGLMLGSELLSAAGLYSLTSLAVLLWVCGSVVTVVASISGAFSELWQRLWRSVRGAARAEWVLIATIGVFGLVTLATGLATAPNNIDSLSYHLPRIFEWLQAGRIEAFATPYPAQLYLPPGAEQIMAIMLAAFATDHAMFLVQWAAWWSLGCATFAASRNLGCSRLSGLTGAIVAMTAPSIIGEAATTQNDLLATAYVIAALALVTHSAGVPAVTDSARGYRPRSSTREPFVSLVLALVMCGAVLAVKPPVGLFAVPIGVWAAFRVVLLLRDKAFLKVALGLASALLAVALINAGWVARNLEQYGHATGPDLGLTVQGNLLQSGALNGVKNLGHELAVPSDRVNVVITSILTKMAETVSGAPINDPASSFTPFSMASERNEDRAGNIVQALLIAVAAIVVLAVPRLRRRGWPVVLVLVTGYFVFSALVRYQTWGGRFLLPALAMGAVLVALALNGMRHRQGIYIGTIVTICAMQALPWTLAQKWRPLVGSDSVLFRSDFAELTAALSEADRARVASTLSTVSEENPETVSLFGPHSYYHEYIWWRYLSDSGSVKIRHISDASSINGPDLFLSPWDKLDQVPTGYREVSEDPIILTKDRGATR